MYLPVPLGKLSIMKEDRLKRDCVGCKSAQFHVEDKNYTNIICQFPFDSKQDLLITNPSAPTQEEIEKYNRNRTRKR